MPGTHRRARKGTPMLSDNLALQHPRARALTSARSRASFQRSRMVRQPAVNRSFEGSIPSVGALVYRLVRPHSHAATHPRSGCAPAHVSRRSSTRFVRGVYRFDSGRGLSCRPLEKTLHAKFRWFDSNRLLRAQALHPVGEPMVRHSFAKMRPHTAVSSLGRHEIRPCPRWSRPRLVRGDASGSIPDAGSCST